MILREDHVPRAARAALVAAALMLSLLNLPGASAVVLEASEAVTHIGETATVCGTVASAAYLGRSSGSPTFLNLDRPYPDQPFTVVIWGTSRGLFEDEPEALFDGRRICVTGRIEQYQGTPQIVVDDPAQIEIADAPTMPLSLEYEERVFVKAVLAALGMDVNYGLGEWDAEAVQALVSFQEEHALEPSGVPDAPTLRALADAVVEMPPEEQTLIIRMTLLRYAQRGD